ncbi:acyltransferase domain-containing protein, partial [Bacillus cereus]|uniref:acyltransferase domain-containing protein n=2 Tax=Bacillati TaxID=1783272 RepID=UPI003672352A
ESVSDAASAPYQSWTVSAKSADALTDQIARLAVHVRDHPELSASDIGYTLTRGRATLRHRAVVLGRDRLELLRALDEFDGSARGVIRGSTLSPSPVVVTFPGQGPQRARMGSRLYREYPRYAEAFDEVCAALDDHLGRSLSEVVFAEPDTDSAALLHRTDFTQPAIFAVEVALYRLLESFGVAPDLLIGHSLGEVTAAYVAGVWSLADAAELVAARGRLMHALPSGGAMVAVTAGEDDVAPLLAGRERQVGIAAVNGPTAVVISGEAGVVDEIATTLERRGHRATRLDVSVASHSPLIEPMLEEFSRVCARLSYHAPRLPIVSTVTGSIADPAELCSPEYWVREIQLPVRYSTATRTAAEQLDRPTFLECGPRSTLSALTQSCLAEATTAESVLP